MLINQEEVNDTGCAEDVKENPKTTPTMNGSTKIQSNSFPTIIIINRVTNGASPFLQRSDLKPVLQNIHKNGKMSVRDGQDEQEELPFIDAEQLSLTIESLTKSPYNWYIYQIVYF